MAKELARVTDVEALDVQDGPAARLPIAIPRVWVSSRTTLLIEPPRMLSCERCQGGGCDRCERSGAFRIPADATLELSLPRDLTKGTLVRVPAPFHDCVIEQLIVEVHFATAPTKGVRRRETALAKPAPPGPSPMVVALIVVTLAAIVGALLVL